MKKENLQRGTDILARIDALTKKLTAITDTQELQNTPGHQLNFSIAISSAMIDLDNPARDNLYNAIKNGLSEKIDNLQKEFDNL